MHSDVLCLVGNVFIENSDYFNKLKVTEVNIVLRLYY